MRVNISGVWKDVAAVKVNVDGTWRTVTKIRVNVAGTWKDAGTFVGPLSLDIPSSSVSGTSFGTNPVRTDNVLATVTGGLGPFTYAWTRLSGSGSATAPTFAVTRLQDTVDDYDTTSGVFRCTVTDSLGATAYDDVSATFTNYGSA